jgi:hypothetical protein
MKTIQLLRVVILATCVALVAACGTTSAKTSAPTAGVDQEAPTTACTPMDLSPTTTGPPTSAPQPSEPPSSDPNAGVIPSSGYMTAPDPSAAALGVPRGQRVPVVNEDLSASGFIDFDVADPLNFNHSTIVPVYDRDGRQIAYWVQDVGWVDSSVVEAPGFDVNTFIVDTMRKRHVLLNGKPPCAP